MRRHSALVAAAALTLAVLAPSTSPAAADVPADCPLAHAAAHVLHTTEHGLLTNRCRPELGHDCTQATAVLNGYWYWALPAAADPARMLVPSECAGSAALGDTPDSMDDGTTTAGGEWSDSSGGRMDTLDADTDMTGHYIDSGSTDDAVGDLGRWVDTYLSSTSFGDSSETDGLLESLGDLHADSGFASPVDDQYYDYAQRGTQDGVDTLTNQADGAGDTLGNTYNYEAGLDLFNPA